MPVKMACTYPVRNMHNIIVIIKLLFYTLKNGGDTIIMLHFARNGFDHNESCLYCTNNPNPDRFKLSVCVTQTDYE